MNKKHRVPTGLPWVFHNYGREPGMKKGADTRLAEAWKKSRSFGTKAPIIAVLDKGFDLNHPSLSTPGKIISPYNFVDHNQDPSPHPFSPHARHGTACASLAAGNDRDASFLGAAPNSRIMPIRIGEGALSNLEIEQWFRYVKDKGAWVVCCSWNFQNPHTTLSTRAYEAIADCAANGRNGRGTIICFSAGNEGKNISGLQGLANHENVLVVGAVNSLDERSSYTNFGDALSFCAPSSGSGGWNVLAADSEHPSGYSGTFGGTSTACALTAGICAYLLSLRPKLTANKLVDILKKTARKIDYEAHDPVTGFSPQYGYGCIDAMAALKAINKPISNRTAMAVRKLAYLFT